MNKSNHHIYRKSPFKFLDAFDLRDRNEFFGRDEEINQLYQMVNKNRLVLVYGQSGTGKTSLVQCGLASRYDATDWLPLFIRRGNDINQSFVNAMNNILRRSNSFAISTERGVSPVDIEIAYGNYLRPLYLIFDQFEELFILSQKDEQHQFINTISTLHQAELPCRILFVIREEYLAALYEFEKTIPTLFDRRLRVEPMSAAKVEDVLRQSFLRFNIEVEDPDNSFSKIVDKVSDKRSGISLPYLQIYLDQFWLNDFNRTYPEGVAENERYPALKFKTTEIEEFGEINEVMARFLPKQRDVLQNELSIQFADVQADEIQRILDVFVTESGTKRPVAIQRSDKSAILGGIPEGALRDIPAIRLKAGLDLLEQSRLIRISENVAELMHDSLAALLDHERSDEQRHLNEVRSRLKNAMIEFVKEGDLPSRNLIDEIENLLPKLGLSQDLVDFFNTSKIELQKIEEKKLEESEKKAREEKEKFESLQETSILIAFRLSFLWKQMQAEDYDAMTGEQVLKQTVDAIIRTILDGREQSNIYSKGFDLILNNLANGRLEEAISKMSLILKEVNSVEYFKTLFLMPRYAYFKNIFYEKSISEEEFLKFANRIVYKIISIARKVINLEIENTKERNLNGIDTDIFRFLIQKYYIKGVIDMISLNKIHDPNSIKLLQDMYVKSNNDWEFLSINLRDHEANLEFIEESLSDILIRNRDKLIKIPSKILKEYKRVTTPKINNVYYTRISDQFNYLRKTHFNDYRYRGVLEDILQKEDLEFFLQLIKNYNFKWWHQCEIASILHMVKQIKQDFNEEIIKKKEYDVTYNRLKRWAETFVSNNRVYGTEKKIFFEYPDDLILMTYKSLLSAGDINKLFNILYDEYKISDVILLQARYNNNLMQTQRHLVNYEENIRTISQILYSLSEMVGSNLFDAPDVGRLKRCKTLSFYDSGIKEIPHTIKLATAVSEIDLSYNSIKSASSLLYYLSDTIATINLKNNPINHDEIAKIRKAFPECNVLY